MTTIDTLCILSTECPNGDYGSEDGCVNYQDCPIYIDYMMKQFHKALDDEMIFEEGEQHTYFRKRNV